MDAEIRAEIDKLHERVSGIKERVVNLEAQNPHINAALTRIESMVGRLNGHLVKGIWAVVLLFLAAVFKFVISGGLSLPSL